MKNTLCALTVALLLAGSALAQDNDKQEHGQVGVFAEMFRFQRLHTNLGGLGGRLSLNVHKHLQLEAEMSYLFRRGFAESFTNGVPNNLTTSPSSLRAINGLFGPKLNLNWPVRPFVTLKGGFINTEISGQPPGAGFTSQINNLRRGNTSGVVYPGGGFEAFLGPIGLRFDIGDEIYFNARKANHNLRLTFGPHIRF